MLIRQKISSIKKIIFFFRGKHLPDLIFEDKTEIRPDIENFYKHFNIPRYKSRS